MVLEYLQMTLRVVSRSSKVYLSISFLSVLLTMEKNLITSLSDEQGNYTTNVTIAFVDDWLFDGCLLTIRGREAVDFAPAAAFAASALAL